jgi:hypothetical protein
MKKEQKGPRASIARKEKSITIQKTKVAHLDLQPVPKTEDEQNALARELVRWVYYTDSKQIEDFPLSKCMNPYKFKHIGDKNEYFQECYELACYMIGSRLQTGVYEHVIDRELALKMLPLYNREYKEWFIETRKIPSLTNSMVPLGVYLDAIPDSPLVPERQEDGKEEPFSK